MPQDLGVAREWALKSAPAGYAKAETFIGATFERGLGGAPVDYKQAFEWYRKAADQGEAPSQNALGRLYEQGLGVKKDYAIAFRWYQAASENPRSGPGSKLSLARMYQNGYGVPEDHVESLKLYCIAMHMKPINSTALADAKAQFDEISKTVTPSQIAEANRRCELESARSPQPLPP
jgi:TPR repeat protein